MRLATRQPSRLFYIPGRRAKLAFVYAALLASALCYVVSPASAAEAAGQRVLLIEHGRDPFLERVGAEIESLGFSLVRSAAEGPLEESARVAQAVAAIRVLPARNGVEVWMADATSGRSLLRQVIVDERPGGPDRDLIALQAAELLRTSLLRDKPAPAPAPQPIAAPVVAIPPRAESVPTRRDTGVQLAFGPLYSPGGVTASAQIGASLHRFLSDAWGLALDVSMPIHRGTLRGVEGSANLGAYFAGAVLLMRLGPLPSPFYATAGAGGAALLAKYDGETRAPLHASAGSKLLGAAYARLDAGIEVTSWLRLGVRVLVCASFVRLSVQLAGNDAATFGPALFAGFGLAELALP